MAGWEQLKTPLIFFEGEDEEALLSRFVELSAKFTKYDCFQIAANVFHGLKDANSRGNQAALEWSNNIFVLERIDAAKRNGGVEPVVLTKETWLAELLAIARDLEMPSQAKQAAVKAYEALGKGNGWMVEAQKIETDDKTRRFPTVIFEQPHAA